MSKRILDERTKGGDFKDWADLDTRVKGIGSKSAAKLSAAGLLVNGQAMTGAAAAKPAAMPKKEAKPVVEGKAAAAPAVEAKVK